MGFRNNFTWVKLSFYFKSIKRYFFIFYFRLLQATTQVHRLTELLRVIRLLVLILLEEPPVNAVVEEDLRPRGNVLERHHHAEEGEAQEGAGILGDAVLAWVDDGLDQLVNFGCDLREALHDVVELRVVPWVDLHGVVAVGDCATPVPDDDDVEGVVAPRIVVRQVDAPLVLE